MAKEFNFFHFFEKSGKSDSRKKVIPTFCNIPEKDEENGSVFMKPVIIDTMDNPLASMSFDDFSISRLLKLGMPLKHLQISTDLRIGFDNEIEQFNNHLVDISDSLFVEPKTE